VSRMRRASALLLVLLAAMPSIAGADEGTPEARALAYLSTSQRASGAWAATPATIVEALAALDVDAKAWPTPARSAFAQLASSTLSDESDRYRGDLRTLYAASVAGYEISPVDAALMARVREKAAQGGDPTRINDDIWLVLALRAAGAPTTDPLVERAVATIHAGRCATGGWGYVAGAMCSADMTGMALAALDSAGEELRGDEAAVSFLETLREDDGGYRDNPPGNPLAFSSENVQSTAWAITALRILGEDTGPATRALALQQHADGGFPHVWDGKVSDDWATAEAIVALTATHPMRGLAVGHVALGIARALEPTRLAVEGAYSGVTWTVDGAPLDGNVVTFSRAGAHT
jgi:hypothetical protein